MKKLLSLSLGTVLCLSVLGSCSNNDEPEYEPAVSSAAIYSFSFQPDTSVMANLDTVFFAINLDKGEIFNASPLPYGTRINKLVPVIRMNDGASLMTLTVTRPGNTDTVYNYLTNSTDSIDFSNGPVKLRVISSNGLAEMNYTITVNVSPVVQDSLQWDESVSGTLPTRLSMPTRQSTVRLNDGLYCLTEAGGNFCLAHSVNPYSGLWDYLEVNMPAGALTETFSGSDNTMYILADDGCNDFGDAVYSSTDCGKSWEKTSIRMNNVLCSFNGQLYGVLSSDRGWETVSTDGTAAKAVPAGMPVEQFSNPALYNFPMALHDNVLIVGGVDANGAACGAWAFDGSNWAKLSSPFSDNLRGAVLISFVSFKLNAALIPHEFPTMLVFGGRNEKGEVDNTVYRSLNYGLTWEKAPLNTQLPKGMTIGYGADAYVFDAVMGRAIRPIESWECPYIYIFGGHSQMGTTYNKMWCGTINRLREKPIQ